MTKARLRGPAPVRVVFDGQSHNNVPAPPVNMPTVVMKGLDIPWVNVAISGYGWGSGPSNNGGLAGSASVRLWPQVRNRAGCTDILVMCGGQGDILNGSSDSGGQTGAVVYQRAIDYADNARAAGFDLILITTSPPIGPDVLGTGRPTPEEQQAIDDYNTLILANSGDFDAVANISVPPLNDATNLTYFQIDYTHFTAAGAQAAANIIKPVLIGLIDAL